MPTWVCSQQVQERMCMLPLPQFYEHFCVVDEVLFLSRAHVRIIFAMKIMKTAIQIAAQFHV